jgi:hypothetical protein
MANTIITPEIVAREALMQLTNNAVMSRLVHRDYSSEFVAGVGDVVNVRKPATFLAKDFVSEIEIQDANEVSVPIKMDKHYDVSFQVTSKEMTLSIEDFSEQLIKPAMLAFNDKIDADLIALHSKITNTVDLAGDAFAPADLINARKHIVNAGAPTTNRYAVIGTEAEADMLNTELFVSAEKVGDEGTALREASLGRKFGMDFYVDQNVDTAGMGGLAFHKNAFALVTRPLALPAGAASAAIVDYDGFGLRVVYGYDMDKKTDTISIDMLCGVKTLDEKLAAVIPGEA